MGRRSFALVLMLMAAPAAAQEAESLGRQVYSALEGDGTPTASIGALLRDSINGLDGTCLNVASYQIFRQTQDTTTLKVECADRPLYLLSIDDKGRMLLSGGDGRVGPMQGIDGPVVVTGTAHREVAGAASVPPRDVDMVSDPRTNDAIPVAAVEAPDPDEMTAAQPRGWVRWLFAGLLATIGLAAFLVYSRLSQRARMVGRQSRLTPYASADKDRLIAEGRQIAPDIWAHPSGLFIARGRRGKRRLFRNRICAYLYWRWGLKIAQVR